MISLREKRKALQLRPNHPVRIDGPFAEDGAAVLRAA